MILQLARIDKELGLQGGTARKVFQMLVDNDLVQKKSAITNTEVSEDKVKEFRNCFNKRSTYKSGLMSDSTRVAALLEWFKLLYPSYTIDEIIKAAKQYIQDRLASDAPTLIMKADNFIKKTYEDGSQSSRLLEYLENDNNPNTNDESWI